MKLLTFPIGMIQTDDFLIRVTKVCPPGFNFNIGNNIDGFSVSGTGYMLAALLCHFKPVIRAFPAKVSLDNEKQPASIRTATLSMESFPESRRINSGLSVSLWQRFIVSCRNSTVPLWQCCFPSRSSKLMHNPRYRYMPS